MRRDIQHQPWGSNRQTKPTEVKVLLNYVYSRTNKSKQIIQNFHSLLTYGLSDAENYYFEFVELNRNLSVHYQGVKILKAAGAGRGVCLKLGVCPKMNENAAMVFN